MQQERPSEPLTYEQTRRAVVLAAENGELTLLEEVLLPDANVLLCTTKGCRFNVKFDVVHGVAVEPVDELPAHVLRQLRCALEGVRVPSDSSE